VYLSAQVKVQRYEAVIDSLKKLNEAERRRTRQARAAHTAELANRTELQSLLRKCLEDVRARCGAVAAGDVVSGSGTSNHAAQQQQHQQPLATMHEARHTLGFEGIAEDGHGNEGEDDVCVAEPQVAKSRRPDQQQATRVVVAGAASAFTTPTRVRPFSATTRPPSSFATPRVATTSNRPMSAGLRPPRPFSAVPHSCATAADGVVSGGRGADADGMAHPPAERAAFLEELRRHEALLVELMRRAFPSASPPALPGPELNKLVAAREARDAAVVAQGRLLAQQGQPPAAAAASARARGRAPDNESVKLAAAAKPWAFNVDTMLSEFLTQRGG
jgi:hypothetical protein